MKLHEGVYENLINGQLAYDMKQTEKEGLVCKTEQIDSAESAKILADFLADAIRKKLEDKDIATEEKINFVNDVSAIFSLVVKAVWLLARKSFETSPLPIISLSSYPSCVSLASE